MSPNLISTFGFSQFFLTLPLFLSVNCQSVQLPNDSQIFLTFAVLTTRLSPPPPPPSVPSPPSDSDVQSVRRLKAHRILRGPPSAGRFIPSPSSSPLSVLLFVSCSARQEDVCRIQNIALSPDGEKKGMQQMLQQSLQHLGAPEHKHRQALTYSHFLLPLSLNCAKLLVNLPFTHVHTGTLFSLTTVVRSGGLKGKETLVTLLGHFLNPESTCSSKDRPGDTEDTHTHYVLCFSGISSNRVGVTLYMSGSVVT